jgi:hypothetical protein
MPFVKGQSGNPRGRPKHLSPDGRTIQDLAREFTQDAFDTLVEIMADVETPPKTRVSAASAILDRGWGRPKQEIEAGENMIGFLADLIAERRARVARLSDGNQA